MAIRAWATAPASQLSALDFLHERTHAGRFHLRGQRACYAYADPAAALLEHHYAAGSFASKSMTLFELRIPRTRTIPLKEDPWAKILHTSRAGARFFGNAKHFLAMTRSYHHPEIVIYLLNPEHHLFELIEWVAVRSV